MDESDKQKEHPDFWLVFPQQLRGGQPAPKEPTSYGILLIIVIILLIGITVFGVLIDYLL